MTKRKAKKEAKKTEVEPSIAEVRKVKTPKGLRVIKKKGLNIETYYNGGTILQRR